MNKKWPRHISNIVSYDGPVWRCRMKVGNKRSTRCRQTRMRWSWCNEQNWESSENSASYHSCIHVCRWTHHWMRSCLWCNVKGSWSYSLHSDSLYCCKRRPVFLVGTYYLVNDLISLFRVCDVTVRFIKTMPVRYSRQKKYSSTWDSTCDISLFWVPIFIILCLL